MTYQERAQEQADAWEFNLRCIVAVPIIGVIIHFVIKFW
jgi:hypothetical protein